MAQISNATYEQLRQILEKQNLKNYSFEEIKDIGDGLVDFYTIMLKFYKEGVQSNK
jgi:hypothetical protein